MAPSDAQIRRGGAARERILETAYDLFSRSGTRAVGVDTIIAESGVAKMTLYRNFASKDDLILEFLRQRDERWTRAWLQAEVTEREEQPGARMLAIFDVFGEWFARDDFEGCAFINVMLELDDRESRVRVACVEHLVAIRSFVRGLAVERRRGGRGGRSRRGPVAHPHEGLDRRRGGGRHRRRGTSA